MHIDTTSRSGAEQLAIPKLTSPAAGRQRPPAGRYRPLLASAARNQVRHLRL
jgi:hypothetical protein